MHEPESTARNSLMVTGLIAIAAVAYWPSTTDLWSVWTDPDLGAGYAHGLLIGLLSVWIFVRARHRLARVEVRPVLWAYPLLLLCSIASLIFWRSGIQSLHIALLPPLILLAVLAAFGTQAARAVAFPVAYLYFSMPGWGVLSPALQGLTVRVVGVIAPLMGLPAHVAGDTVSVSGVAVFEITPACSGVNFLVVGLAVAALIGEVAKFSLWRRGWLFLIAAIVAIASNWVRALLIIAMGYATDMRLIFATRDHILLGWVVFAAALLIYVWWATGRATVPVAHSETFPMSEQSRSPGLAGYLAAAIALAALPCAAYLMTLPQDSRVESLQLSVPEARGEWRGPLSITDSLWQPVFVGRHVERRFEYEGPTSRRVEMMAIGYSRQGRGRDLANERNSLLGERGLTALSGGTATSDGRPFREVVAVDGNGHRSLIWSIYDIGGRTFVTPLYSQLWYGVRSFHDAPYSALFALRTACESSCEQARATLASFVQNLGRGLFASVTHEPRSDANRGPT